MALPSKKTLNGETDVEDAYGSAGTPKEYVDRGYAGKGLDTTKVTAAPRASKGSIPTPKVADETGETVTGTRFGPNTRGYARTGDHADDWHDAAFGG
jgi:hypothetical protein